MYHFQAVFSIYIKIATGLKKLEPVVKGSVFENDHFDMRFNFWLGVLVGVLNFKTATKLIF